MALSLRLYNVYRAAASGSSMSVIENMPAFFTAYACISSQLIAGSLW